MRTLSCRVITCRMTSRDCSCWRPCLVPYGLEGSPCQSLIAGWRAGSSESRQVRGASSEIRVSLFRAHVSPSLDPRMLGFLTFPIPNLEPLVPKLQSCLCVRRKLCKRTRSAALGDSTVQKKLRLESLEAKELSSLRPGSIFGELAVLHQAR